VRAATWWLSVGNRLSFTCANTWRARSGGEPTRGSVGDMPGPGFTHRPGLLSLPAEVLGALQEQVGSRVASVEDRHGGMSPGPAAIVTLENSRRVFVKAGDRRVSPRSVELYEDELDVLDLLGPEVPHAPLVTGFSHRSWVGIVTEVADGDNPGPPWTIGSVDATLVAIDSLGTAPQGLPPLVDRAPGLDGWRELAATDRGPLDNWERERIDRLAGVETGWEEWTRGEHLVHLDVRGDNAIATVDGVRLVDWSFGCHGERWVDRSLLAADVAASGQADAVMLAERCLQPCPKEAGRLVVALAGMWRRNSSLPDHPNLPTFRAWQRHRAGNLRPLVDRILAVI
jgi:hypothetical protein